MKKKGKIFVVSGPSGVGKTTLLKMLLENYKEKLKFSVSDTSRPPRKGEVNGTDYYFIHKNEFELGIKENNYLEYAIVHDNYYGTSKKRVEEIINSGTDILLDIDVQGALTLMSKKIKAKYIFISPPNLDTLRERLLKRSTDSMEIIEKRLNTAKKELEEKDKYDYIIINDDLNDSYLRLKNLFYA